MEYLGRFNHLSQYASEYVRTDADKKFWFVHGLHTKLQVMLVGHTTVSYNEIVSIAITPEEKYYQYKEVKKKKNISIESSGSNTQHQRIIYQPIHRSPYHPPQQQGSQQSFV